MGCSASRRQVTGTSVHCSSTALTASSSINPHMEDKRTKWVNKLVERRGRHKGGNVSLANKNARVLLKLLTTPDEQFVDRTRRLVE